MARIAALTAELDDIVAATADANVDDEHDPEGSTIAFERARVSTLLSQGRAYLGELALAQVGSRTARTECVSIVGLQSRPNVCGRAPWPARASSAHLRRVRPLTPMRPGPVPAPPPDTFSVHGTGSGRPRRS